MGHLQLVAVSTSVIDFQRVLTLAAAGLLMDE